MSNDEYQQQQFWEPTYEELLHKFAESIVGLLYKPVKFPLNVLTENQKSVGSEKYKWKLINNYKYHKNKLNGK